MNILIAYGTTEGQTAAIAERIAARLIEAGNAVRLADLEGDKPEPGDFDRVVVGASVHFGKYQDKVTRWVAQHVAALNAMPSWFYGVSLSEAGGLTADGPAAAQAVLDGFLKTSGWHPVGSTSLAGALKYREYNWLKRRMLKAIVAKAGGDTDTSRNHEYTDWFAVDRFAGEITRVQAFAGLSER
ncbi:MAG: protoporphyrinogen oxidase [Chloroflexi bacterium]|nr:protoporphyrinogen oxidase [Dehalococcoidia bacterium]MCO5200087.1 protoporphyrinogen oxidase [Chloroflexota bacterium]MCZ7578965.1 protoporphyrinogen oxidase [Dehalococcoidia bacterium]